LKKNCSNAKPPIQTSNEPILDYKKKEKKDSTLNIVLSCKKGELEIISMQNKVEKI